MLAEGPALSAGPLSGCVGLCLLPQGDREGGKPTPGTLAAAHPRLGRPHPLYPGCPAASPCSSFCSQCLDHGLRPESRVEFLSGLVAVWV